MSLLVITPRNRFSRKSFQVLPRPEGRLRCREKNSRPESASPAMLHQTRSAPVSRARSTRRRYISGSTRSSLSHQPTSARRRFETGVARGGGAPVGRVGDDADLREPAGYASATSSRRAMLRSGEPSSTKMYSMSSSVCSKSEAGAGGDVAFGPVDRHAEESSGMVPMDQGDKTVGEVPHPPSAGRALRRGAGRIRRPARRTPSTLRCPQTGRTECVRRLRRQWRRRHEGRQMTGVEGCVALQAHRSPRRKSSRASRGRSRPPGCRATRPGCRAGQEAAQQHRQADVHHRLGDQGPRCRRRARRRRCRSRPSGARG